MNWCTRNVIGITRLLDEQLSTMTKRIISVLVGVIAAPIIDTVFSSVVENVFQRALLVLLEMLLPFGIIFLQWRENDFFRSHALFDRLTGLFNRRGGDEALRRELGTFFRQFSQRQRARGRGRKVKVAVAFIDVNRLKQVNDTFGHAMGDKVICEVGRILQRAFPRSTDIVIRQGGDEFMIVVPQMRAGDLKKRIEEDGPDNKCGLFCLLSEAESIKKLVGAGIVVTASVGIASGYVQEDEYSWDDALTSIIGRADEALYLVKRARKPGDSERNVARILREDSQSDLTISDE